MLFDAAKDSMVESVLHAAHRCYNSIHFKQLLSIMLEWVQNHFHCCIQDDLGLGAVYTKTVSLFYVTVLFSDCNCNESTPNNPYGKKYKTF